MCVYNTHQLVRYLLIKLNTSDKVSAFNADHRDSEEQKWLGIDHSVGSADRLIESESSRWNGIFYRSYLRQPCGEWLMMTDMETMMRLSWDGMLLESWYFLRIVLEQHVEKS